MTLAVTVVMHMLAAAAQSLTDAQRPGVGQAARADGESMPEALRKLFERELPPLPKTAVEVAREAGALKAEVEAKGKVEVGREGEVDVLAIPIGTQMPIQCYVYRSRIDGAGSIAQLFQRVKKKLQIVSAQPVDVAALAGSPALFVEMVYLADAEGGKKNAGQLKQSVMPHPDRSLMCLHDEPGYSQTFRRIVKGLGASLSAAAPDERSGARFAEVIAIRAGDTPVGFVEGTTAPAEDGASTSHSYVAMVAPPAPGEIVTQDKAFISKVDASGHVVAEVCSKTSAGELETIVTLTRAADGKMYGYEGTVKGKKVKGTFATADGLAGDWLVAKRMPLLLSGGSSEERFQQYSVDENPVGATEVVYRKDAGPRRVTIESSGTKVHATLDEDGYPSFMQMPIGALTITYERIWSRGKP